MKVDERGRPPGGWTASSVLRRARTILRQEGLRSLWMRVVGETVYRRMLILHDTFDNVPPMPEVSDSSVEFRPLERHETEAYLRLRPDQSEAEILSRMDAGQVCFAAVDEGRVIQASWLAPAGAAWIEYLDWEVPLSNEEAYAYDWFAAPSARGRTLFREQIGAIFSFFSEPENRRRWFPHAPPSPGAGDGFIAAFHIENRIWALFVRMGWRPTEIVGYVGAGRLRWRFRRRVKDAERLQRKAHRRASRRRRRRQRLRARGLRPEAP